MRPLFIGGCPRSGTTLLGAMLGASPDVVCLPETIFVTRLAPPTPAVADAGRVLSRIHAHVMWSAFRAVGCTGAVAHGERYADLIESLVRDYAARIGKPGAGVWIDHTPDNTSFFARLRIHWPDARLVHIVRDGRAVAQSIIPTDFGPNEIRAAAHFWMQRVGAGLAAQRAYPDDVMLVRYEDLLTEPVTWMRRIAAFAGLPYSDALTRPTGFRVPGYSRSLQALIGTHALDADRIDAWRRTLPDRQVEIFEYECGDFLAYLGYRPIHPYPRPRKIPEALPAITRALVRSLVTNLVRHRIRHWRSRGKPASG